MLNAVHVGRLRIWMEAVERWLRLGTLNLLLLLGARSGHNSIRFDGLETRSAEWIDVKNGLVVTSSKA